MYIELYQWQIGLERILTLPLDPCGFDTPCLSLPHLGIAMMIPCTWGLSIIYEYYLNLLWILLSMIWYLCKSLWIISLVWPTRMIFLAVGEVLSFGFNLVVLDPSDRKGNDTYCLVAIEDKKMVFISYCMSLSLYIMSSFLKRYSVLMNLIL